MQNKSQKVAQMCNTLISNLTMNNNASLCNMTATGRGPKPPPRQHDCVCSMVCIFKALEFIYIIGVIANILIVSRVFLDKKLWNPTFVAIACLGISDTLFIVMDLIIAFEHVVNNFTECPPIKSRIQGDVYRLINGTCWFAANGHLTLLAVVRFLLIVYPLKAHVYLTTKRVFLSSASIWALGLIMFLSTFIYEKIHGVKKSLSAERTSIEWIVVYLIPFAFMCVLHLIKLRLASNATRARSSQTRMTSIILFVILAAFLFPFPRFIFKLLERLKYKYPPTIDSRLFHNASVFVFFMNNSLNPFVYAIFSEPFRRSIRGMFKCKSKQRPNNATGTNTSRDTSNTTSNTFETSDRNVSLE